MSFEEKLSLPNANYNRIYKSIVELIPNDWIQLFKTKTSQQSLLKVFNLTTEAQKKFKIFKNFQIKKSTSLFNLITRIIINLLNLFHGQIILKGILFSVLKIFLTGSKNVPIAIFFWSGTNLFISPYLEALQYTEWGIPPLPYVLDVKKEKNLILILYFTVNYPKLLYLNYIFHILSQSISTTTFNSLSKYVLRTS